MHLYTFLHKLQQYDDEEHDAVHSDAGPYAQSADSSSNSNTVAATVPEDMHGSGHVIADASKDASFQLTTSTLAGACMPVTKITASGELRWWT